jgi:hypothetical protein
MAQTPEEKEAAAAAKAEKEAAKKARTEVTVEWQGNSRVYSLAMHGEDFEALADEFATKKNGRIV